MKIFPLEKTRYTVANRTPLCKDLAITCSKPAGGSESGTGVTRQNPTAILQVVPLTTIVEFLLDIMLDKVTIILS